MMRWLKELFRPVRMRTLDEIKAENGWFDDEFALMAIRQWGPT